MRTGRRPDALALDDSSTRSCKLLQPRGFKRPRRNMDLCVSNLPPRSSDRQLVCIVMRYNWFNGFWPPWMRNSRSHGCLRPHDFLLSRDTGSLLGPTRTGYCTAGSTRGGLFAARHSAGRPALTRRHPDFGTPGFVANVTCRDRIPFRYLARMQHRLPLLIPTAVVLPKLNHCFSRWK